MVRVLTINVHKQLYLNTTNCKGAIDILDEWYGNKQILVSPHKQKLDKLHRIKPSNDISRHRKMVGEIEVCLTSFKVLNISIATSGAIIVPFLNEKLSSDIRLILSQKFRNDDWQDDDILKLLKREF